MNNDKLIKTFITMIGTSFTWLMGAWDTALIVLVTFICLDYATGLLKGYVKKELSSYVGAKGIAKKAVIFIVLIAAVALDRLLGNGNWLFRTMVCYFYVANEGLSLLENCTQLGLPTPPALKQALVQLKEGNRKEIKEREE